ncbi:hypothetical protein [Vulcanisaeta distributa]|uniref:hypothetical protein n=1 Tax=Vulcanisaeta distributa TaxID=164451 RepID=UPI001FB4F942|nr:hypothetical protein [Vulcanisaeta distributa]
MACTSPIGGCNYEVTTNGVTPSYVGAYAEITNTMTVQSYTSSTTNWITLQYNPDTYMVFYNPFDGSTGKWVQGTIAFYVATNPPGNANSWGYGYFLVQVYNVSSNYYEWENYLYITINGQYYIPWPLISGAWWYITYNVGNNGLISSISAGLYIPNKGGWVGSISVPSQHTNRWYRSNVVWAGANSGSVTFNSGGSGTFYYCSNLPLYQGPLAQNTAENSNVQYTQIYTVPINPYPYPPSSPWTCISYEEVYQGFQT